jgi:hypothetical protein
MKASDSFTGLSPHLIASIYPMKRVGDGADWARDGSQDPFQAPLTQASLDLTPNWQSPFEGSGVESRFPALAQMSQAGMFNGVLNAIGHALPKDAKRTQALIDDLEGSARKLVGKSGVTKLGSTQVFSGMQPIKIQMTAFLRAFKDPILEVEEPLKQLQQWTLPRYLAPDGVMAEFIKSGYDVLALMPSEVPTIVGFAYRNRIFSPMVIESVSDPLDAPIDKNGWRISATVQITLCSLTALDRADWAQTYKSELVAL